jgi:hypothetical protein
MACVVTLVFVIVVALLFVSVLAAAALAATGSWRAFQDQWHRASAPQRRRMTMFFGWCAVACAVVGAVVIAEPFGKNTIVWVLAGLGLVAIGCSLVAAVGSAVGASRRRSASERQSSR